MGDSIGQSLYSVMTFALHRASGNIQVDFDLRLAPSEDGAKQQSLQLVLERYPARDGWGEHQAFARVVVGVGTLLSLHRTGGALEIARALLKLTEQDDAEVEQDEGGKKIKEFLM